MLLLGSLVQAAPYDHGDTITIWWNVMDTTDGTSIAATTGPTIEMFKTQASGLTSLGAASSMTQDSAGMYYYDFVAPAVDEVYSYEILWTSQGKDLAFFQGGIHVRNMIDDIFAHDLTGAQTDSSVGQFIKIGGDSTGWASIADVWMNQDTSNVDTSLVGEWLTKAPWNAGTRSLTDKSGFSLTQSFPTNFDILEISSSGSVTPTDTTESGYDIMNSEMLDTIMVWLGYRVGCETRSHFDDQEDTLIIMGPGEVVYGRIIYKHLAGSAGDPPDSTETISAP